jgi:hypothetical protein
MKRQPAPRQRIDTSTYRRGIAVPIGRRASIPLHVMLEPEQKQRYEQLALDLGMSLRELVITAIEGVAAAQNASRRGRASMPESAGQAVAYGKGDRRGAADIPWMVRTVTSLLSRVGALEERNKAAFDAIEEVQTQAGVHWGGDWRKPIV